MYLAHNSKKSYSFSRSSRITSKADYAQVFNKPQRFSGKYWQVLAKNVQKPHPRLGLAIAKRVLNRAVDRNIYKRIAREVFRLNQHELKPLDFVVMAKKMYQQKSQRPELHRELLELLKQV